MTEVSIIVPVYNAEKYLRPCIDSILNQSFPDFELILVDDGSSDDCGRICDEYAETDSRVVVVHQKNTGQAAARNAGVSTANTDLLCFLDADDMVHTSLLDIFYCAVNSAEVGMAACGRVQGEKPPDGFFDPLEKEPEANRLYIDEGVLLELMEKQETVYWTPFPCMIKRRIFEEYPFTPGRIMEDNAIACKWLTAAKCVVQIREPLYFYRDNPTGTMHTAFSPKRLDFLWALEEQLRFYQACGYAQMQGAVAREYIRSALWFAKRIRTELNDPKLSRRVVRRAVRIAVNNKKVFSLSAGEKDKLLKAAHPLLFRIRKKIRNLFGSRIKKKDPGPSGK